MENLVSDFKERNIIKNFMLKADIIIDKKIWTKNGITKLEIELLTGRTHQIRVHMAYLGYPIIGDNIYSNRKE